MMAWLIWRIEPSKEQKVATAIQDLFENYLPTEIRSYRHSRQRCRAIKEIPLLPRLLFVRHPFVHGLQDIIGHKYVLGLARDSTGGVFIIPDCQIAHFQEAVAAWVSESRRAYEKKQLPPKKPDIVKSFEDMAQVLKARSGLEEVKEAA